MNNTICFIIMANLLKIKLIAEKKNIPLKEVAKYVGITQTGLSKIIRENSTKTATLEKIAIKLNVPVSVFFDDEEQLMDGLRVKNKSTEACVNCEALGKEVADLKEKLAAKEELLAAKEEIISLLRGAAGEGKERQVS